MRSSSALIIPPFTRPPYRILTPFYPLALTSPHLQAVASLRGEGLVGRSDRLLSPVIGAYTIRKGWWALHTDTHPSGHEDIIEYQRLPSLSHSLLTITLPRGPQPWPASSAEIVALAVWSGRGKSWNGFFLSLFNYRRRRLVKTWIRK